MAEPATGEGAVAAAVPQVPVLCIDGPSGSGKGTICVRLARALDWHLLDSGALYRLVALDARRSGTPLDDPEALAARALALDVRFTSGDRDEPRVELAGEDVTRAIRTDEVGQDASVVAALPAVRAALLDRQRAFRQAPGLIADGRDMGTVVFADATLKVFLTASAEERARRRYKQLIGKGLDASLADLFQSIRDRDARDAERTVSPLKPADDAIVIDSTEMDVDAVYDAVLRAARERGLCD
ncbi:MAG TPA: (d)CMP kinase [Pseudomonadales bacterium]|nr:(d)CMP kinase [Pseudomonadales bacterium]